MTGLYRNTDPNFGFTGLVPPGVTVENNVKEMLTYRQTHTFAETFSWMINQVKIMLMGIFH